MKEVKKPIIGEIYIYTWQDDKLKVILLMSEDKNRIKYIDLNSNKLKQSRFELCGTFYEASEEQKKLLRDSIIAGEYVKNTIVDVYEIY